MLQFDSEVTARGTQPLGIHVLRLMCIAVFAPICSFRLLTEEQEGNVLPLGPVSF